MRFKFELGDLRALITVVNVMLIMRFGLSIAWFGLVIAGLGLVMDGIKWWKMSTDFRVNSCIIHCANVILNIYFMTLL